MIQVGALFKLLEQPPEYLPIDAPESFARSGYKEVILRGFDVRLEMAGRIYELSSNDSPGNDGLPSRGLALVRQVVALEPAISLDQKILLANAGDAVAISWRVLGKKVV